MSLARDITTVGSGTLMSRLLAFARDAGIAALLGTGPFSEAFFAVLQVINFFRRLLAEGALNGAFGDAAYNLILHDAPYSARHAGLPFHWHVEVLPRRGDQAGFEWGSGVYTNVVDPDEAAATLRAGLALG